MDLINFVGLAAVLSALGMYGIATWVRHSKTTEAVQAVANLATLSAEYYNASDATQPTGAAPDSVHAMRHFPPSSRAPVPEDALSVRGRRYQSNPADWAGSPWRELHFSIVQPQYYQYAFEATGTGANAKATAVAHGDLDADGRRSTFSLAIAPDGTLTARVLPEAMVKEQPLE
ncbi:MAG: hypothetical protein R3B36_29010 [Polyangiaceae bacterium]